MYKPLCIGILLCVGCAGQDAPEAVASALDATKTVYVSVEDVRERLDEVHSALCEPAVLPDLVAVCAKLADGLAYADQGSAVAHDAINAAIEAYNTINEELPE